MGFLLSKLLTLLASPVGIALALLVSALILSFAGRHKWSRYFLISSMGSLWLLSTSYIANGIYGSLENEYPNLTINQLKPVDVIVVLGGGVRPAALPNLYPDMNDAGDRLLHGFRLYQQGVAEKILVSGGQVFPDETVSTEAIAMKSLLMEWGVPEAAIIIEDQSRTTRDNAVETQKIVAAQQWQRIALVTSAAHMPRSVCSFSNVGMDVIPVPTDYVVTQAARPWLLKLMPSSSAQDLTARGMKEYLGRWVYQWRDWC